MDTASKPKSPIVFMREVPIALWEFLRGVDIPGPTQRARVTARWVVTLACLLLFVFVVRGETRTESLVRDNDALRHVLCTASQERGHDDQKLNERLSRVQRILLADPLNRHEAYAHVLSGAAYDIRAEQSMELSRTVTDAVCDAAPAHR